MIATSQPVLVSTTSTSPWRTLAKACLRECGVPFGDERGVTRVTPGERLLFANHAGMEIRPVATEHLIIEAAGLLAAERNGKETA